MRYLKNNELNGFSDLLYNKKKEEIMGFIGRMIKFKVAKEVGKRVWDYMKSDKGNTSQTNETPNTRR